MESWRLIKSIETNGAMQMAIDEAILIERIKNKVPTLRFFTWNPPCLTIGYFQNLEKEVNTGVAKELGIDVVRRYTGGGAVLHEKELTYSIAIPEKLVSKDIKESYKIICNALIRGLSLLGLDCEFQPVNDIIVNNKKISGNAQTRKEGVILQHGTILLDVDVKKMFRLLKVSDEKIKDKMIKSVEERVTSLKEIETTTFEGLRDALIKGFEEEFGITLEEDELTPEELSLADKLYREKYSTKEWMELR
ncbi:MAG: biotin/lipoate A/B protein ligase family protein [Candidatus Woesearchaeota archaeon]